MRPLDPRLVREVPAARSYLVAAAVLALISAVALVAQAASIGDMVARGFLGPASLHALIPPLLVLAGASVVRGLAAWAFEAGGALAAAATLSTLRLRLLAGIVRGRPGGLGALRAGEVAASALDGADALEPYFARFLPQLALGAVVPPVLLAWVFWHDLTSGLVLLCTLPLIPVFGILIGRATERATLHRVQALATLSTHFVDVVRGLPTLRAYRRSRAQTDAIARYTDDYRRTTMATLRIAFLSAFALELAASLGTAVVAVELGIRLVDGGIALSPALAILVLAPELYAPLRNASAQFHASADGIGAAGRLFELIDLEAVAAGTAEPPRTGTLRIAGLRVGRPGRGLVLDSLDLAVEAGERVAIVGPSGAGKSTLLAVLLRFAEPAGGRVTFGGDDVETFDPDRWRERIAWLPQRPLLERDPALAHLSAGERRRAALERALAREAPLLLLDEPTAHLDGASAEAVVDAIADLPRTRAAIVVTHDLRVARAVDRVFELRGGGLRELARTEVAA
jgi:ATP-binding cassette, subfamily C, bacterial CydD